MMRTLFFGSVPGIDSTILYSRSSNGLPAWLDLFSKTLCAVESGMCPRHVPRDLGERWKRRHHSKPGPVNLCVQNLQKA